MPGAVGPVLVQGPVEVVLDDGSMRVSERPVALCACGRSGCYPFCDTSHRRRSRPRQRHRPETGADSNWGADSNTGADIDTDDDTDGGVGEGQHP